MYRIRGFTALAKFRIHHICSQVKICIAIQLPFSRFLSIVGVYTVQHFYIDFTLTINRLAIPQKYQSLIYKQKQLIFCKCLTLTSFFVTATSNIISLLVHYLIVTCPVLLSHRVLLIAVLATTLNVQCRKGFGHARLLIAAVQMALYMIQ